MKKLKFLSLFLVSILLFSSVNLYALGSGGASAKIPPQYPLVSFELITTDFPLNSTIQLQLAKNPVNAANSTYSDFTWYVSNSDFSVSSTGLLTTPNYSAKTNLTVTHKTSGMTKTFVIDMNTLASGYYKIKNKGTGEYLVHSFDTVAPYIKMTVSEMDGRYTQIWQVTSCSNDEAIYNISQLAQSSYLSVYNATSPLSHKYISTSSNSSGTESRWRFSYREDSYSIALAAYPDDVISVLSGESYLKTASYTDNYNYNDEWIFEPVNMNASLLGVESPNHLHYTILTETSTMLSNIEYTSTIHHDDAFTVDEVKSYMASSGVFLSRSHGSKETLYTHIIIGDNVVFSAQDICTFSSNPSPKIDLSQMHLMLFIGCHTAESPYSLIDAAIDAGAEYAIGTLFSIDCNAANNWVNYFMQRYTGGDSIYSAALYATTYAFPNQDMDNLFRINH